MTVAGGTRTGLGLRTRRLRILYLLRVLEIEKASQTPSGLLLLLAPEGVWLLVSCLEFSWARSPHCLVALSQKVTTLDSENRLAISTGPMRDAFNVFRSSSVTPRATEQGSQTYTGTFPLTTFSINSARGGKPTP